MIVLDANILIRAVLGRHVRELLDTYGAHGIRFFSPDVAFDDVRKYLPSILRKHGKTDADVSAFVEYLRQVVEMADHELYGALKARHDSACAAAMRMIGQCWPRLWH